MKPLFSVTNSQQCFGLDFLFLTIIVACLFHAGSGHDAIEPSINHGMVIDAGSTGSRMHVYQWEPRIYDSVPPPTTYPLERSNWTQRMRPGISAFVGDPDGLRGALEPLVEFAKEVLKGLRAYWGEYPLFLGATAGVRELSLQDQLSLMADVRALLGNQSFSPFLFKPSYARMISGEEEGVFGWTAANFLMGTLQEAMKGTGTATSLDTFGALDLGGGSTQITFFQPDQEVMENMFKLQIGSQKHWNLYTHSYLGFGHVASRERMDQVLVEQYLASSSSPSWPPGNGSGLSGNYSSVSTANWVLDKCLPHGRTRLVSYGGNSYTFYGNNGTSAQNCVEQTYPIFQKASSQWCSFVYHNQCSFSDIYQPPIYKLEEMSGKRFLGFSGFSKAFTLLRISPERVTATLTEIQAAAENVCQMNHDEIIAWAKQDPPFSSNDIKSSGGPDNFCFFTSFVVSLLNYGYGFEMEFQLMAQDKMNGLSISWALGNLIYQVNSVFTWQYVPDMWWANYSQVMGFVCIGLFLLNVVALPLAWKSFRDRKIEVYTRIFG